MSTFQYTPSGSALRPSYDVFITDNTQRTDSTVLTGGAGTSMLFVTASPKGKDRVVQTITGGRTEFMQKIGLGPFSLYGQPLLNAYSAAMTSASADAMIHVLRVTAENATYSTSILVAKYYTTEDAETGDTIMHVKFVTVTGTEIQELSELDAAYTVPDTPDPSDDPSTKYVKIMSIAYLGRGEYGKNVRYRITSDRNTDKTNYFKNYYFSTFVNESTLEQVGETTVTFLPESVVGGASVFIDDVVNDPDTGSEYVYTSTNQNAFKEIFDAYNAINPGVIDLDIFDPLTGMDKRTNAAITNFVIDPVEASSIVGQTSVDIQVATGIALERGSDGDLAADSANRQVTLDALYEAAFSGQTDPYIASRNRFPTTMIVDANFNKATKLAIVSLTKKRTDCMALLDLSTEIYTTASVIPKYLELFNEGILAIDDRVFVAEAYNMKVRDPYSSKIVTVTSTWWLASRYFTHIFEYNGKYKPLAGNQYGVIEGMIKNSIYPVFDEDLDTSIMDDLADMRINFAKYNPNQVVVRATQNTSQRIISDLTEQSAVLVLLDVKRDCERLVSSLEYEFMMESDIARFNTYLESIAAKYRDAQVASITAAFSANEWQRQRGIMDLNVNMVNKKVVKKFVIRINVDNA